ncbi:biotin transporter BioY [Pelagibacterium xiamenense]|uniref:biotin transporter BioY n=1 Tax=Pelagibacterium xiamenense TaxID=2901140 RepID=UPI001E2DB5F1|nr:biotin transporter BioY [Pelagibacterium xiamenense]MCD7059349.1 biotin transporter BioY [Pelagibacterium xiamenense]
MAMTFATSNTLLGALQPKSRTAQAITAIAVAFLGSILLTIAAKVSVPVWPVPVSLQSMAVAVIAAAFGLRIGAATVTLYLAQGLAGLPVFAGAYAGPAYVMGPTGGFLVGFLVMAVIIGYLADRGAARNVVSAFAAMMLGAAALFAFGFTWLLALSGQAGWIDQSNVLMSAYKGAVEPFILWDTLKMAFAALTVVGGWALVKRNER